MKPSVPKLSVSLLLLVGLYFPAIALPAANTVFSDHRFTTRDAILVSSENGEIVYAWQPEKLLVPASLAKLATVYLAIEKWGLSHRFKTDFYRRGSGLWVKGYGDPYLVSEEIDRIVAGLKEAGTDGIRSIHTDDGYFGKVPVPGRSSVADPYNAPLSAVAANFNTVFLEKSGDELKSAELQTPLTQTAVALASSNYSLFEGGKAVRFNLQNRDNAQQHFAQILAIKLGIPEATIHINASLPEAPSRIYRHKNSQSLEAVITGAMKYSNNFVSNQLFLKLPEQSGDKLSERGERSFAMSQAYVAQALQEHFDWQGDYIVEGAGLSRDNRLSAEQIDDLLQLLAPYKHVFRQVDAVSGAKVFAKTGTLDDVSNYAGFIEFPERRYRFVFLFNRATPYGYRDQVLQALVRVLEPGPAAQ